MDTPTIRPCRDADVPAITAIYAHHVLTGTASFETSAPDESEMRRRRDALADSRYPWLVAEIGGEVRGYAYAGPYRVRPAYRFSVEDSVYVSSRTQRRGIGTALLRALIRACTDRGHRQMVAIIGDSAQVASIGLHRAAGFELVGTLKNVGYKHDRWLDSVFMQRALGEGAGTPPDRMR